jgi:hypothetical protein
MSFNISINTEFIAWVCAGVFLIVVGVLFELNLLPGAGFGYIIRSLVEDVVDRQLEVRSSEDISVEGKLDF